MVCINYWTPPPVHCSGVFWLEQLCQFRKLDKAFETKFWKYIFEIRKGSAEDVDKVYLVIP